jgi:hypothetical protein
VLEKRAEGTVTLRPYDLSHVAMGKLIPFEEWARRRSVGPSVESLQEWVGSASFRALTGFNRAFSPGSSPVFLPLGESVELPLLQGVSVHRSSGAVSLGVALILRGMTMNDAVEQLLTIGATPIDEAQVVPALGHGTR